MCSPMPTSIARIGPAMAPESPASAAPSPNTTV